MSDDIDIKKGTPCKLKEVGIAELEKRFASVVNELIDGDGNIEANIPSINFKNDIKGTVELNIIFSKKFNFKI